MDIYGVERCLRRLVDRLLWVSSLIGGDRTLFSVMCHRLVWANFVPRMKRFGKHRDIG